MRTFPGAARRRHVEITTKNGNTVAGNMVRVKDDLVQLSFENEDGDRATVSVDVEAIDVLIVADRADTADVDDSND